MKVLGIETSCDETAAAIVSGEREIHANLVLSQLDEHRPYGGVVPEIAARSHLDHIDGLVARALNEAGLGFGDLDGVAATAGPGLIGGVFVGVMTAKAIAAARKLPFLAVNHLEGHALTVRLTHGIDFPYLLLLVSGGHCQLLAVEGVGRYRRLGGTIDDAVGEAFDKSAKLLGLDYPGGPALERAARDGEPRRFDLPRPPGGRLPGGGGRRAGGPLGAGAGDLSGALRPVRAPGGGRWRGRQSLPTPAFDGAGGRRGRRTDGAADPSLHRQRRDDRLGRDRAVRPRAGRPAGLRAPAPLAPGELGP
jgi:hypothetical protein